MVPLIPLAIGGSLIAGGIALLFSGDPNEEKKDDKTPSSKKEGKKPESPKKEPKPEPERKKEFGIYVEGKEIGQASLIFGSETAANRFYGKLDGTKKIAVSDLVKYDEDWKAAKEKDALLFEEDFVDEVVDLNFEK